MRESKIFEKKQGFEIFQRRKWDLKILRNSDEKFENSQKENYEITKFRREKWMFEKFWEKGKDIWKKWKPQKNKWAGWTISEIMKNFIFSEN